MRWQKKIFYFISIITAAFVFFGCQSGATTADETQQTTTKTTSTTDTTTHYEDGQYSYIPQGSELSDEMAVRFLNMTTFGATPTLVKELKSKGVVQWVDEQLNMPYDAKKDGILRGTIVDSLSSFPDKFSFTFGSNTQKFELNEKNIQMLLKPNAYNFNQHGSTFNASGAMGLWVTNALYNVMLSSKSQLRHRVAYALHQWVVASSSLDNFFKRRFDALAYYYDKLEEHAFDKYEDMLYDVSMTPAMAVFLTYMDNQQKHTSGNNTIYPDENYGREIMQLFTIGQYKLTMGGERISNSEGYIYNYNENDVKEMARVFTGLSMTTRGYSSIEWSRDAHQILKCRDAWHDNKEKTVMGESIPAGQDCYEDVHSAIDILTHQDSFAPYIAMKLIRRLTKSNPNRDYIQRVATAFRDSDNSLKEATRAVLLDPELWDDLKNSRSTKLKEPFLAYFGALRALEAKPKYKTVFKRPGKPLINRFYIRNLYGAILQMPLMATSVFSYYADDFIPNNEEFKIRKFVAPEYQIQTRNYQVGYSALWFKLFTSWNHVSHEYNDIKQHLKRTNSAQTDPYKYSGVGGGDESVSPGSNTILNMKFAYDAVLDNGKYSFEKFPKYTDNNGKTYEDMVKRLTNSIAKRLTGKELPPEVVDIFVKKFAKSHFGYDHHTDVLREVYVYWIVPITQFILNSDFYMVN